MKVIIVAESFLPSVNGVTHSVLHVIDHLQEAGHQVEVLAASPAGGPPTARAGGTTPPGPPGPASGDVSDRCRAPVTWLPSVAVPGYPSFRVAAPGVWRLRALLGDMAPDVVHLAAPFVLGWDAVRATGQLGIPSIAVYQTDLPSYAARYGLGALEPVLWRRVRDVHAAADRTQAPSRWSAAQLRAHQVPRVHRWERGVDASCFHPDRRSATTRAGWAGPDQVVVGFVGRLAAEKQVEDLRALEGVEGIKLVVIGDGPMRPRLERMLPTAHFTGWMGGVELAGAVASLDVVVHPGENDTFGQTIQEAMASGVPVVATARGGPVDLIEHGRTGMLYPPGRLDVLRQHIEQLVTDGEERRSLGRAGRETVQGRTWSRMTDRLIQHYTDTIAVAGLSTAA